MFHFTFADTGNSLYAAISDVQLQAGGLSLCGTVGDGSAESWFEASLGTQVRVKVLPVWAPGEETLCQRYDIDQLEDALGGVLAGLSFRSEAGIDPSSGAWQQHFEVSARSGNPGYLPTLRLPRPHLFVQETAPTWQQGSVSH